MLLLLSLIHRFASAQLTSPTFYFALSATVPNGCPSVQTFADGNYYGPCNGGNGVQYSTASKYWVAVENGAAHCGQSITMNYNSRSIQLVVMDSCPGCANGHVDMSLEALIELTGSADAACAINTTPPMVSWSFGGSAAVKDVVASFAAPKPSVYVAYSEAPKAVPVAPTIAPKPSVQVASSVAPKAVPVAPTIAPKPSVHVASSVAPKAVPVAPTIAPKPSVHVASSVAPKAVFVASSVVPKAVPVAPTIAPKPSVHVASSVAPKAVPVAPTIAPKPSVHVASSVAPKAAFVASSVVPKAVPVAPTIAPKQSVYAAPKSVAPVYIAPIAARSSTVVHPTVAPAFKPSPFPLPSVKPIDSKQAQAPQITSLTPTKSTPIAEPESSLAAVPMITLNAPPVYGNLQVSTGFETHFSRLFLLCMLLLQ